MKLANVLEIPPFPTICLITTEGGGQEPSPKETMWCKHTVVTQQGIKVGIAPAAEVIIEAAPILVPVARRNQSR